VSALYRSAGRVPETFLLGSQRDAPEDFLLKLRDTLRRTRFEYRSCFISYAREDAPFVDELAARLQRAHVPVWRDSESLQPGQTFESRIIDAIARYDCFVVVLSASALESDWVRKEIALAIERKPYRILPIRLDDAVLHSVETGPLELRRERHVADFSRWGKPVEFKTQFERLLRALRRE
jgi:hypothetical protein